WTGGNQQFLRESAVLADRLRVPVSIDFLRLLDSRNRNKRFNLYGLINEPNCEEFDDPDPETGLRMDVLNSKGQQNQEYKRGGEYAKYGDADFKDGDYPYYPDPKAYPEYGEPTGVVGLRKFKNPKFDAAAKKLWQGEKKDGQYEFTGMK